MKVIAFSLWVEDTRYTLGALQNVSLAKMIYPGWICRFYVGKSTPKYIVELLQEFDNVEIVSKEEQGDWRGMFWRFEAASDPEIDVLIVRDCDSRLWFREKSAVDEWLESKKGFHIMRDNPQHTAPILGGMWGVRKGVFPDMVQLIDEYKKGNFWQVDQNFLKDVVYPIIKDDALIHDPFFEDNPFPLERQCNLFRDEDHFVGQAYAGSGRILDKEEYFQEFMKRECCAKKS